MSMPNDQRARRPETWGRGAHPGTCLQASIASTGRRPVRPPGRSVRPQRRRLRRRAVPDRPRRGGRTGPVVEPAATCGTPSTSSASAPSGFWTIAADPSFGVPLWDENVVAEVRSYDQLSTGRGPDRTHRRGRRLATAASRGTPRRVDPPRRGRDHLRLRRRAAERPRGLPPPLGRPAGAPRARLRPAALTRMSAGHASASMEASKTSATSGQQRDAEPENRRGGKFRPLAHGVGARCGRHRRGPGLHASSLRRSTSRSSWPSVPGDPPDADDRCGCPRPRRPDEVGGHRARAPRPVQGPSVVRPPGA